jgi:hypothetical protein
MRPAFAGAVLATATMAAGAQTRLPPGDKPRSPVIVVVGCALKSAQPHIWTLSNAGERSESSRPGIATDDLEQLAKRPLGQDIYQLIGVADFVDADTSRTIGDRGALLPRSRVNTTGMLAHGHRVAVKGLYIAATPPRINLTSVVDLAERCPA